MFTKENDPCSLQYTSLTNLVSSWILQKLLAQKLRAPFCTAAIFCLAATSRQVKPAPEYNEEPHLKEAPPSGGDRENCTTVLSDLFLLVIACGGTYRRMGQDPKKRVLNISVLREIFYYSFHNFLHVQISLASPETPVTISRWNSQRFLPCMCLRCPWVREGSLCVESASSSTQVISLK